MNSLLVTELKLALNPVAIMFSDTMPEDARQLKEDTWGCIMALYAAVAKKGITAAFDRNTYGCVGAGVGLCLGDTYKPNREFMQKLLSDDEGYLKNRELVREFMDEFQYVDIPTRYVIMKPLAAVDPDTDDPVLISMPANPDQLSALAVLLNFRRHGNDHVAAPFGAGCQSICVLPYNETLKDHPRAIIGNMDLTSRKMLPADILTFTVAYKTFLEMEEDVPESFVRKEQWARIADRIEDPDG